FVLFCFYFCTPLFFLFFFFLLRRLPISTLFPYTTLFRSCFPLVRPVSAQVFDTGTIAGLVTDPSGAAVPHATITITNVGTSIERDRKSTRLNSSHQIISYAVFCLKKKKKKK